MLTKKFTWIQCNCCGVSSSEKVFYLTKCWHIICLNCLRKDEQTTEATCPACKKRGLVTEINSKMGDERLHYFKDPDKLLNEYKQKVDKIRMFQNYHREKSMKIMNDKYERAVAIAKSEIKNKEEIKVKYTQLATVLKEKSGLLKKKDEEINRLKGKVVELSQSVNKYKEIEKMLEGKIKKLQYLPQQAMINREYESNKTDSFTLKRRREEENNFIGKPKPKYDISQIPLFSNKEISQPVERVSRSYKCVENKRMKLGNTQFLPSIGIPKFNNDVKEPNFFSTQSFDANITFGVPGVGDVMGDNFNFSKLLNDKGNFNPKKTSTQGFLNFNPIMGLDNSGISEISPKLKY